MSTTESAPAAARIHGSAALWHRWPTALGLLAAAFLFVGGDRDTVIVVLLVALACYLAAAALGLPWVAWAAIPIGIAGVAAGQIVGVDPWFVVGGASVVLVVLGLVRRVSRPALTAQSLAMLAYGGTALAALALAPVVGAVLASVSLIAHAIWDVIHYRRNAVVPRSLAEFCIFLDVPLGVAMIVLVLGAMP